MTRRVLFVVCALVFSLLAACSKAPAPNKPALNLPVADDTVAALATSLTGLDVTNAPLASSSTSAQAEVAQIISGMDGIKPSVSPGSITYDSAEPKATATLSYSWPMPSGPWAYEVTVPLVNNGQGWKVTWSPSVIHPKLDQTNRLVHTHTQAKRAPITGNNGVALVEEQKVVKVGIDKTLIKAEQYDSSARSLAALLGIDQNAFAQRVASGGPAAFVIAATLRQADVPAQMTTIPGAIGVAGTAMLPFTKDFADELLGTVGEATSETVSGSNGFVMPGDIVGLSGLQRRYDEQLRGVPGDKVTIVARRAPSQTPAPSGSASGSTSASASRATSGATTPGASSANPTASVAPQVVHSVDPVAGKPLSLSMDLDLQRKFEGVMAGVPGAAAAALVRPSDGAILAIANSPGTAGQADASFGQWAPGSTFKIATALALLRKGYTPETILNCTATTTVDGWPFKNYGDFPSSMVGKIPLKDAIAQSCNTAFINEYGTITGDNLRDAAASLGVGVDYDAGFPVFYGTVPAPDSNVKKAQEFIGQGGVLASPVAMAGLAASVKNGGTVIPWLVTDKKPVSRVAALQPQEAEALRQIMAYTVQTGSGRVLQGYAEGAKTGTAEYGTAAPLPTHAWMICYTSGDLAIAVWVKDGQSGSGTAGPIIKQLLAS